MYVNVFMNNNHNAGMKIKIRLFYFILIFFFNAILNFFKKCSSLFEIPV